jgi:uncharacterized membrane protein YdjX (TVP38/TMEM64 family)
MSTDVIKRYLPLAIIIILVTLAWIFEITDYINLETIKSQRSELLAYVTNNPVLSITGFIAIYIISVALSLPIATLLTLLGGFLFGQWLGTFLIVISATIGATLLFLSARSAIGSSLREKAGPFYKKIELNMNQNSTGYLLFMRLVPLFPFFIVNIVPALFNVRLIPYIITTFVGIIPGTFVYANVGRELGSIESITDLASKETLLAFTLLGIFALIPTIYKMIQSRKNSSTNNLDSP